MLGLSCIGFMGTVHVHGRGEQTGSCWQRDRSKESFSGCYLYRLHPFGCSILTIAPRPVAALVQQRAKKTLVSPAGGCARRTADCSGDGDRAAIYRCGLGRAGGPHAGAVMLLRSQIKLLPAWISWWVSKAFARRAAGTAVAEVPWLQHSRRDTNWVS